MIDRTSPALVFAKPHLDLTNELIRRYNAGEGGRQGGGAAASARQAAPRRSRRSSASPCSTSARSSGSSRTATRSCSSTASTRSATDRIVARKLVAAQRAALRGPLPRPPGDAGRADHRGAGAGGGAARRAASAGFDPATQVIYFMAIDRVKFRKPVVPGDVLDPRGGAAAQGRRRSGSCAARPRSTTRWSPRPSSWPASSRVRSSAGGGENLRFAADAALAPGLSAFAPAQA